MTGKIKKVFPDKNYGYISVPDSNEDYRFVLPPGKRDIFATDKQVDFDEFIEFNEKTRVRKKTAINIRISDKSARAPVNMTARAKENPPGKYYLPKNTAAVLSSGVRIDNSALCTEKYIRAEKKLKISKTREFTNAEKSLLRSLNSALRDQFGNGGFTVKRKLGSRMAIGLGSASVFETGIILHRPYGFPYIPGSSIKGAIRSFLNREHRNEFDLDMLFGTRDKRGSLVIFDAYPVKIDKLELDIMNPHFSEWYQSGKPPTDTMEPVPIIFYAVPAGTEFIFHVSGRTDDSFQTAFEDMLSFAGLGAKTAVGYGWFR